MEEQDELEIPSAEEYSQVLHDLKDRFSESDLRVLRELYRRRGDSLPVTVSELAKILGLPTAEAANEACFSLARLLQAALQGKEMGLQMSMTTIVFSAPKRCWRWRMDSRLARGMELAGLTGE